MKTQELSILCSSLFCVCKAEDCTEPALKSLYFPPSLLPLPQNLSVRDVAKMTFTRSRTLQANSFADVKKKLSLFGKEQ